jgi:shikimate kinase
VARELTRRHVVLVGLPGSGKTTVGRLVAERLGAPWVDLDTAIESRAGKTVTRIFAEYGEAGFRALERELGAAALEDEPAIISPGGGFLEEAAHRRYVLARALVVYLETSPEIAASRLGPDHGRPLLHGGEPARNLARLLERRRAGYVEAHVTVSTDRRSAAEVADVIVALAREMAGW